MLRPVKVIAAHLHRFGVKATGRAVMGADPIMDHARVKIGAVRVGIVEQRQCQVIEMVRAANAVVFVVGGETDVPQDDDRRAAGVREEFARRSMSRENREKNEHRYHCLRLKSDRRHLNEREWLDVSRRFEARKENTYARARTA